MSDPRNVAHAKKIAQEKKHHPADPAPHDALAAQRGKKPAAVKGKRDPAGVATQHHEPPTASEATDASSAPRPPAALEPSLVVLTKLKELEFHSRAHLERLAELTMAVEDELKQTELVGPLREVYSAQSALQTKLTALIEVYKAECERMHAENV